MCTGTPIDGVIIPSVLSVGGALLQANAANDAAERQQKIINNAAEETARLNTKKADTINNFAEDTFNPQTRDQRYENAATKNESSLADALLSANGGKEGQITDAADGRLSNDYTRAKASSTASATEDILKRARLMARSNAGNLMYNDESLKGGQLASDVGLINGSIQRTNNAAKTDLGGVRNNGSLVGGLLTGFSSAVPSVFQTKADFSPSSSYGGILGMKT